MIFAITLFRYVSKIYGVNILCSPSALPFQILILYGHELLTPLPVGEVFVILDL